MQERATIASDFAPPNKENKSQLKRKATLNAPQSVRQGLLKRKHVCKQRTETLYENMFTDEYYICW